MIRRPPRSTRTDTPFPYTTLYRSLRLAAILERLDDAADALVHDLDHRGVGGHLADLDRALFGGQLVPGDVGVAGIASGQIGQFGARRDQPEFALLLLAFLAQRVPASSEERRVGKKCVSTCYTGVS